MFRPSDIMILNKTGLLPYVQFDRDRCIQYARRGNPGIRVFQLTTATGEGMDAWRHWLKQRMQSKEKARA